MRIVLLFTLAFAAACAAGCYLPEAAIWFLMTAVGICLLCVVCKRSLWKQAVLMLFGYCVGFCWVLAFSGWYLDAPAGLDGITADVTMTASDYSYATDYGSAVDGKIALDGRSYDVKIYLNTAGQLYPGDRIQGSFRFRYTAGGLEDATYHRGEGMFLLAYPAGDSQITGGDRYALRYFPANLRWKLTGILDAAFSADAAPFARALLLGDDSGLDYAINTAFSISGIRHVVAVSGLHVAILFSIIAFFTRKRRILTAVVGIPVLLLFAAMAGLTPSIIRSCIMQTLFLLALCFKREYDPPTALSFAALVMLVVNPLVITSVSFQLSVGSIAGIFLISGKLQRWLLGILGGGKGRGIKDKLIRWLASSVSVSLGATSLTAPLTALYFGTVSLVSMLTNLLTLWVITFIFCGIVCVCAVGWFWLWGAKVIAWIVSWAIRFVLFTAKLLASLPLAAVYTQSIYIVIWLVLCYVLLAIFLIRKCKQPILYLCGGVLSLCAALMISWSQPLLDDYRMTVLDVGQGQCILLQSEGRTYMVDCGGSSDETTADIAAETLLSQGISRLDGLILTHYDSDHTGAAQYLLTRISTDTLFLPALADEKGTAAALRQQTAGSVITVTQDLALNFGDTRITVFASENLQTSNESSLCVLFQKGNCDILITGDRTVAGEFALLAKGVVPELEVLVAGHHGAESSTGQTLLASTTPETVVISVGAENYYGHPSQAVLSRLEEYGCTVRRTDLEGTIIIRG